MASRKMKTRKESRRPVFDLPKELSGTNLPTYSDVMRFYFWVKNDCMSRSSTKRLETVTAITDRVASRVEEIWMKASIPIVTHNRVSQIIRSYYDKYLKLLKNFKERHNEDKYNEKINCFKEEGSRLFDIASCKCAFDKCNCEKTRKVPVVEQSFLIDQRSTRMMFISSVDKHLSKKLSCKNKRRLANVMRIEKHIRQYEKKSAVSADTAHTETTDQSDSDDDIPLAQLQQYLRKERTGEITGADLHDTDLSPQIATPSRNDQDQTTPTTSFQKSARLKTALPTLARECDRHGISDRAAAAIASAVLQDFGLISPDDSQNVIDKSKIRRERMRKRNILQDMQASEGGDLRSLYFDGRKDVTITNVRKGSKWYKQNAVEEHISLIEEPGSKYIGHITPTLASAGGIKRSLLDCLKDRCFNESIS